MVFLFFFLEIYFSFTISPPLKFDAEYKNKDIDKKKCPPSNENQNHKMFLKLKFVSLMPNFVIKSCSIHC